ncbi:MAG: 50S ribosomal protein L3 [Elusimicrobiales bacterium]
MSDLNTASNAPQAAQQTPETPAPAETAALPQQKPAPTGLRAILGEKVGMTQIFDGKGRLRAVTVVKAGPCVVANVRTPERDGYSAICLGYGETDLESLSKPVAGQFAKRGVTPARRLREFRLSDINGWETGQTVTAASRFAVGDYVDVQGVTKGRGFAGGMKRHGFHGMPGSHGSSDKERAPGSIASRRSLGRVIPGQRMAGHMGCQTFTAAKLEVVKVDADSHLLYINGAVPGTNGGLVAVLETSKPRKKRVEQVVTDKKAKKGAAKPAAKK